MKILFNFIPIKKGGGQQVAMSFVNVLKTNELFNTCTFLVTKGTEVQRLLSSYAAPSLLIIEDNYIDRLKFETFGLKKIVRNQGIEIIFTMFGPDLPKVGVPSVVGCAYSNLFFPEIDFWKHFGFKQRLLLKLIDRFRIKRTLQADGIIFENSSMEKRCHTIFNYPVQRTIFIKPSITKRSTAINYSTAVIEKCAALPKHFKVLLLSTWQKNKNMDQVPYILKALYNAGVFDVSFVMTVAKNHPFSIELMKVAQDLGVEKNIVMIDAVQSLDVPYLYDHVDVSLLLSSLESFSNNIIEAWTYQKPLLIANLEWAKAICNAAALYADPFDPADVAKHIITLKTDPQYYQQLVNEGLKEIETYPSPEEKVEEQLAFVKKIATEKNNKL